LSFITIRTIWISAFRVEQAFSLAANLTQVVDTLRTLGGAVGVNDAMTVARNVSLGLGSVCKGHQTQSDSDKSELHLLKKNA